MSVDRILTNQHRERNKERQRENKLEHKSEVDEGRVKRQGCLEWLGPGAVQRERDELVCSLQDIVYEHSGSSNNYRG